MPPMLRPGTAVVVVSESDARAHGGMLFVGWNVRRAGLVDVWRMQTLAHVVVTVISDPGPCGHMRRIPC